MQINFDPNINLFKNKTKTQIINTIPSYKKLYKPIFNKFISEIDIDPKCIHSINIIRKKENYGIAEHFIQESRIYFNIKLADDVLLNIRHVQNSTETFMAKSIFQHELFHCVEIKYLYEKCVLQSPNPLDDSFGITTTYNFLYDEAVKLWSEFFACYHNRKINEWHECPDARVDINQLNKWISATKYYLDNHEDIRLCEDMLNFLHKFWYNMISLIAVHLHNHEKILIDDYKNTDYDYISVYFDFVYQYLKTNLDFYPVWLSEENYIKLGKALMKILEINNITYSTDDLSDNFIFVKSS